MARRAYGGVLAMVSCAVIVGCGAGAADQAGGGTPESAPTSGLFADHDCPRSAPGHTQPWDEMLVSMRVGGVDRVIDATPTEDDAPAVADQAAHDFSCPVEQVHVGRSGDAYAWRADACGHHAAYAEADRVTMTTAMAGHVGRCVFLHANRFVRLDQPTGPALDRLDDQYAGPQPVGEARFSSTFTSNAYLLAAWAALVDAGARDLACPAGDVVPGFWRSGKTSTPVAEGCGQRAVYLPATQAPYVLASKVATPAQ